MTFEIYKLEWILSRHTFGNTTCPFSLKLAPVFLRIEFALVEQRLAADERGDLPFVETDFKTKFLHVHQLLEQRKPFFCFNLL